MIPRILSLLLLLSLGGVVVRAQDSSTETTDNFPTSTSSTTGARAKAKPQASPDPKWEFAVTPYAFLARLDGQVGVLNETAQVNASFRDIFRNLNFALMGTFEARKENWVFVGDAMYMSLSGQKITPSPLFSDIDVEVKETIIDPEVGYRVFKTEKSSIDLMGGARIWHVKTHLTFQPRIRPLVDAVKQEPLVSVSMRYSFERESSHARENAVLRNAQDARHLAQRLESFRTRATDRRWQV